MFSRQEGMKGLQRLLRIDLHDSFGGWNEVRERTKKGIGTVWLFTHNAINDGLALISLIRGDETFAGKELIMPMSKELFVNRGYRFAQKPMDVQFYPIDTPEVRAHQKDRSDPMPGLFRYLTASRQSLERGGMVALAPQAQGNQGVLDSAHQTKAFSLFMDYMGQSPSLNFSVVPMGISYPKSILRERLQKGFHAGERMRLDIGRCYSREDVLAEIQERGGTKDDWAYNRLAGLLPFGASQ